MQEMDGVRGVLVDVDGTLLVGDRAVPGAPQALARLRRRGIPFLATTNTTRRPRGAVAEALSRAGIEIRADEVVTPARLARKRITASGRVRTALFVPAATRVDFEGVEPVEEQADWIVLGDLGSGFDWATLNRAFGLLRSGAGFIALHRNRWWSPVPGETVLDAGAFVAALEYAAGVEAEVVGKPSRAFFDLAIAELGLTARDVLVVGDDPETDAAGARAAGVRVALVLTGKLTRPAAGSMTLRPDLVLDSIAELSDRI